MRIKSMKTNILKIGATSFAVAICVWATQAFAQTTTTVTTNRGAFNEYVPGSQTVVVRTETGATPLRYSVTKQTTIVDEAGAPVAIERISPGSPLSVEYSGSGDHLVASRIVVQKSATVSQPAAVTQTSAVTQPAAVTQQQTTTTTRELTHDEKHALKEQREHEKKAAKKEIEKQKDALDKQKEALENEDH